MEISRIGRGDRRGAAVLVLVAAAVVLAVLKPWQAAPDRTNAFASVSSTPGPVVAVAERASPRPTMTSSATAASGQAAPTPPGLRNEPDRPSCGPNLAWHLLTMVRSGEVETASTGIAGPVRAASAADRRLRFTAIAAAELLAIGYCLPTDTDPAHGRFFGEEAIWRSSGAGHALRAHDGVRLAAAAGGPYERWFVAPQQSEPGFETWQPGRYAISITDRNAKITRWVGLDFGRTLKAP